MIQPTMTAARLAWLEELSHGPANRHRSLVGYQCMQLGWTEWNWIDKATGLALAVDEPQARWGDAWYAHCRLAGERLTPQGWAVLRRHLDQQAQIQRLDDERRPPPIRLWKAGRGEGD